MSLSDILQSGRLAFWSWRINQFRKQHTLNYLFWECTLSCNFFCRHCGSSAGRTHVTNELTTKEIKHALYTIAKDFDAKKITLAVTGGEPLLRPDLFEVMAYASSLGFPWGMVTNGYLVTPAVVEAMKKTGMKTVVVSIDGIGKDHDQYRNMKGAYTRAIQAVRLLADAKFLYDLQITTTVHKGNINQLERMYKTFLPLGITSWRVFDVDPIGRAEGEQTLLLDGKELKKLLCFIQEKRKTAPIDVTYGCGGFLGYAFEGAVRNHYFYCTTGINTGSILHTGDIFVCPNVPRVPSLIQGNVRKDRFSTVWNKKFSVFRTPNRTACEQCTSCYFWKECRGNSFHLWDFGKKEPKRCHLHMLENI